jgi:hypothetical protein
MHGQWKVMAGAVLCALAALVPWRNVSAQGTLPSLSTAHFEVKYAGGIPEEDVRKVVDYLEGDYTFLSERLGLTLRKKLEVRIFESVGKYMMEANVKRPWRGAIYQRGVIFIQPVRELVRQRMFERSLSYEVAMAFLEQPGEKGCPRWLRESFAVYHAGETEELSPPIGEKVTAFSDLEQEIQQSPNPPQRDDVHFLLGQTMVFFVKQYGEAKAHSMFKAFDGNTGIDNVFRKTLGVDYATIEKAWAAHIVSVTSSLKK